MKGLGCLKKGFSTKTFGFRYPDEIVSDLKKALSEKQKDIYELESSIINNIHFFDSDQYTDIVTLLGKAHRGTPEIWDLLERKIYDFDISYIQAKDMFNSNIENDKFGYNFEKKLIRELNSDKINSSEMAAYKLFH